MPTIKVMLHKIINNALYVGKVAHDYQIRCKSVQSDNSDILMSDKCLYAAHTFEQGSVPKHNKPVTMQKANYEWILWNSPVPQHLWRECKTILHAIKIAHDGIDSYHSAILALDDPNLTHSDDAIKLRAIIKQNLIAYALWALYTAEQKINEAKQQDQLTDEMIDNWIRNVTSNFQLLVKGEINMLLFHQRQIDITRKRQVGNNMRDCHSEREKCGWVSHKYR